jgi:hypothetical protein
VIISHDKLRILQDNLIRSHSAGVGPPLSQEETRRLLALRINVLAKGHSGIRRETLEQMVAAFNANCLSGMSYFLCFLLVLSCLVVVVVIVVVVVEAACSRMASFQ